MIDKESYSPQEVAQMMKDYLVLYQKVEKLRAMGEGNIDFIRSEGAKAIREEITKRYADQVPQNVRDGVGLEDILMIR